MGITQTGEAQAQRAGPNWTVVSDTQGKRMFATAILRDLGHGQSGRLVHRGRGPVQEVQEEYMTEAISVQVGTAGSCAIIAVAGEIDIATVPPLRTAIDTVLRDGARRLVVDLTAVGFIDSSGLNVLVGVVRRLGPGRLGVVATQPNIRRVFGISGVDTIIPLFDSVDAATEAATGAAASD
jgi:anti-sigma B factor antagonist